MLQSDPDFVEFINYETNINEICMENPVFLSKYHVFFNLSESMAFHEKICDSDGLLNTKYWFKYFSNYDLDELIFSRMNQNFPKLTCRLDQMSSLSSLSMFDYIELLDEKYGGVNVAYFHFQNFLVLQKFDYFKDQIMKSDLREMGK